MSILLAERWAIGGCLHPITLNHPSRPKAGYLGTPIPRVMGPGFVQNDIG